MELLEPEQFAQYILDRDKEVGKPIQEGESCDARFVKSVLTVLASTKKMNTVIPESSEGLPDVDSVVFPIRIRVRMVCAPKSKQAWMEAVVLKNDDFNYTDQQRAMIDNTQPVTVYYHSVGSKNQHQTMISSKIAQTMLDEGYDEDAVRALESDDFAIQKHEIAIERQRELGAEYVYVQSMTGLMWDVIRKTLGPEIIANGIRLDRVNDAEIGFGASHDEDPYAYMAQRFDEHFNPGDTL